MITDADMIHALRATMADLEAGNFPLPHVVKVLGALIDAYQGQPTERVNANPGLPELYA
jgi:hypothetical protein